ncbi:tRNA pseudouridine(55) synthase TruB [Enteractinococcus coprophilus]|uniref:tRNA pseudouridine synthase B n=1 Tax=Enteractinococcus coprophilus TaxID=1027633 RepID=A0A543AK89_9MICC|nr:tRNA pseudouridine(55) synthase TruB [Enteractinococcus coprophilus]TQL72946.1 tRNA pseudouridine synthase B [Enteractinococcus coprophilus]
MAQPASGLILVDKPAGWTSHDVVSRTRKIAGTRKVGHAGTLDPMATGMLVIGFNKATRLLTYIVDTTKIYRATIRLGHNTTTDDADGEITQTRFANAVTREAIEAAIIDLTGTIQQVPSSVSAIKIDGKRAYQRVREGETVDIPAREVTVHRFDIEDIRRADDGKTIDVDVEVECTAGTYIRALARDLGEALNTGGYLTALRRTAVGPYRIEDAVTMDELADNLVYTELSTAMIRLFDVRLVSYDEAKDLIHGRRIAASKSDELLAATLKNGHVIALIKDAERAGKIEAKPEIVFATLDHLTGAPS